MIVSVHLPTALSGVVGIDPWVDSYFYFDSALEGSFAIDVVDPNNPNAPQGTPIGRTGYNLETEVERSDMAYNTDVTVPRLSTGHYVLGGSFGLFQNDYIALNINRNNFNTFDPAPFRISWNLIPTPTNKLSVFDGSSWNLIGAPGGVRRERVMRMWDGERWLPEYNSNLAFRAQDGAAPLEVETQSGWSFATRFAHTNQASVPMYDPGTRTTYGNTYSYQRFDDGRLPPQFEVLSGSAEVRNLLDMPIGSGEFDFRYMGPTNPVYALQLHGDVPGGETIVRWLDSPTDGYSYTKYNYAFACAPNDTLTVAMDYTTNPYGRIPYGDPQFWNLAGGPAYTMAGAMRDFAYYDQYYPLDYEELKYPAGNTWRSASTYNMNNGPTWVYVKFTRSSEPAQWASSAYVTNFMRVQNEHPGLPSSVARLTYRPGQIASYQGRNWVALLNSYGQIPPQDGEYWADLGPVG